LKLETINYFSSWYEVWSKAGAGPDFRENDPLVYIQGINWVENWIDKYFFTKVSDFLFSIFLGLSIVYFVFKKDFQLVKNKLNKNLILIFFGLVFLLLIWFFKFPSLRYGGHILIISIIIIPFSLFFNFVNYKQIDIRKKFTILFSIAVLIFISKNVLRIYKEFNYSAVDYFKSFPIYFTDKVDYQIKFIDNEKIYKVDGMCWAIPSPCLRNINQRIERKYNYRIYLNE